MQPTAESALPENVTGKMKRTMINSYVKQWVTRKSSLEAKVFGVRKEFMPVMKRVAD